ncbi:ATP-binding protein [Alteromonas sp. 14N.309.X.WAT.G.H12]|uniref:ATP-binding protein n=1 Tax=Alteromonas sp. 14N.309.X.WAT.G.H12 TaxID=3120824 RepID=UPI002FD4BE36
MAWLKGRLGSMGSFNLKVLGWFWLTLLVCLLSIFIPASIISKIGDNALDSREVALMDKAAQRVDLYLEGRLERVPRRLNGFNYKMPYQLMIVDTDLNLVASSVPIRNNLREQLNGNVIWQFIHQTKPQQINVAWTRLIGPVALSSNPDWRLILWRPERPKFNDIFRDFPLWSMLVIFLFVTTLMSWLLVRYIARPLNRLGKAFNEVGHGRLAHRVKEEEINKTDGQFVKLFCQFNDMASRIEALIKNQKRQSADISHELRTPLTRLQMTLALLRKKNHDTDLNSLLERAEKESELLNLHIQRLSELTTLEARAIQDGKQVLTLSALLSELCEDAAFEAQELGMQWQHQLCEARLQVYEEPFVMAIENVVRNAFKYARGTVSLDTFCDDNTVSIVVSDDGPGVGADELDKLTGAFYRTDDARHSETGGLGLGLAIAAESVRLNDGELLFSRAQTGGLQVSFRFPLYHQN